ncbi:hypothetical protein SNEBB_009256 [Seison nebaliae]|nr:hypothetical protein SNEBB_009256 [Seison nebaliae]
MTFQFFLFFTLIYATSIIPLSHFLTNVCANDGICGNIERKLNDEGAKLDNFVRAESDFVRTNVAPNPPQLSKPIHKPVNDEENDDEEEDEEEEKKRRKIKRRNHIDYSNSTKIVKRKHRKKLALYYALPERDIKKRLKERAERLRAMDHSFVQPKNLVRTMRD